MEIAKKTARSAQKIAGRNGRYKCQHIAVLVLVAVARFLDGQFFSFLAQVKRGPMDTKLFFFRPFCHNH
jgi:hypothetical protein